MQLRSRREKRKRPSDDAQSSQSTHSSRSPSLTNSASTGPPTNTSSSSSSSSSSSPCSPQSELNQVIIDVQLISNQMMERLDEKERQQEQQEQQERRKSHLKIEQCRVVLDQTYDEVTTVFHLTPDHWEQLHSQRCWFCCKAYNEEPRIEEPVPCAISMQWLEQRQVRFVVDGSFCNFACSKGWSKDFFANRKGAFGDPAQPLWGKTEQNANAFLYRAWTQNSLQMYMNIPEALPRRLLAEFGGPLTYTDYLYHNNADRDVRTTLVTRKNLPYPMISCRQLLLEEVSVQDMSRNLSSEAHLHNSRVPLTPADMLLRKRIQQLQSRGGNLNQNEGF